MKIILTFLLMTNILFAGIFLLINVSLKPPSVGRGEVVEILLCALFISIENRFCAGSSAHSVTLTKKSKKSIPTEILSTRVIPFIESFNSFE